MKKLLIILLALISLTINAQTVLTLQGNTYTSTDADQYGGPIISLATVTTFKFLYNSVTAVSADGYFLQCGTDLPSANDGNFNQAIVSGNYFDWNGTNPIANTHGILASYNNNYNVKFNYLDWIPLSIVVEGTGYTYTSGGIHHNVMKKGNKNGITIAGVHNIPIYNNTFFTGSRGPTGSTIKVEYFEQTTPDYMTHGTKIKNNIFYSLNTATRFISVDSSGLVGLECDYNLYYCEGGDHYPTFYNTKTFETYTWAQWQALGFDLNSVVIDPDFIDTVNFVPATRLNYGTDLGAAFEYGLTTTASWVVGTAPDTTVQDAIWQVGARLYESIIDGDYYVATNGSDANAGTFAAPWLTWQKAFNTAVAGNVVYFRGGVYPTTALDGTGVKYNPSGGYGNDGSAGNVILYTNYPGEVPILDGLNVTSTPNVYNYGVYVANLDHVTFKGLHMRNFNQLDDIAEHPGAYDIVIGWEIYSSNNIILDQLKVSYIGGIGIRVNYSDTVYVKKSDIHNCCDTLHLTLPGSYGTGISVSGVTDTIGVVTLSQNRTWRCADQGVTSPWGSWTIIDSCWSFANGAYGGDGNGFKTSANGVSDIDIHNVYRLLRNNLAFHSNETYGGHGFTTNETGPSSGFKIDYFNNVAYDCDLYGFTTNDPAGLDGDRNYTNNISYLNDVANTDFLGVVNEYHTNSWTGFTVTSADFVSLDSTGVTSPRQIDGSLPILNFLKLASTSDLINAGTNIGLTYKGSAPDLGAFEYNFVPAKKIMIGNGGKWQVSGTGNLLKNE